MPYKPIYGGGVPSQVQQNQAMGQMWTNMLESYFTGLPATPKVAPDYRLPEQPAKFGDLGQNTFFSGVKPPQNTTAD